MVLKWCEYPQFAPERKVVFAEGQIKLINITSYFSHNIGYFLTACKIEI